ncbi:MAG: serine hydrolase [Proteobacteria bacterium]|nr:serine hydrolase [Pseudomonadota bacterium]
MVLKLLAVAVLALNISCTEAATPVDTAEVEAALETRIEHAHGIGYVIGIIDGDERRIITAGVARKSTGAAPTEDSLFEIGSITKTFTGILLADMVLKGEVALDDTVASYLPKGINLPMRNGKEITLRHLATHSSGLPRLPSNIAPADISNPYADYTVDQMYAFLADYTLERDIGELPEYSNLGMGLLGHVLALKAGVPYETLIKQRILEPLGMADTTITISADRRFLLTDGHDGEGKKTSHWDLPTFAGAGAILSSGKDMMIYMAANMGLVQSALSPAIEMSHEFQRNFGQGGMEIGLAWFTAKSSDGDILWHNGGTGGYRSYMAMNIEKNFGVLVLANSNDSSDLIGSSIIKGELASIVAKEKIEVTLSKSDLQRLLGEYQLAPSFTITITVKDGALFADPTGQPQFGLYATSKNEFFLKAVDASISFIEDAKGSVVSLVLHQNGANTPGLKLTADARADLKADAEARQTVNGAAVTVEDMAKLLGAYQLAPGFTITIAKQKDGLTAQITGQQAFPLFAKSSTEFFLKAVGATLTFAVGDDGKVTSLTVHQNGQEQEAKKIS